MSSRCQYFGKDRCKKLATETNRGCLVCRFHLNCEPDCLPAIPAGYNEKSHLKSDGNLSDVSIDMIEYVDDDSNIDFHLDLTVI